MYGSASAQLLRNLISYTLATILYHYQSNTNGQTAATVRNTQRTETFKTPTLGSEVLFSDKN